MARKLRVASIPARFITGSLVLSPEEIRPEAAIIKNRPLNKPLRACPVEEHMANDRAARAPLGKGNSAVTRVKERPGFPVTRNAAKGEAGLSRNGCAAMAGLSNCGASGRAFLEPRRRRRNQRSDRVKLRHAA